MPGTVQTSWPEGVIARYLAVGGGVVDVTERPGFYGVKHPTETHVSCSACPTSKTFDWGWSPHHDEFGTGPQPDFDETGQDVLPAAREWAQSHAETCRAVPRPTA
jgi:hypothetical protein